MKGLSVYYRLPCFLLFLSINSFLLQVRGDTEEKRNMYIVYMGAAASPHVREDHVQLLGSVLKRRENVEKALVHSYKHGFSGFSARLTDTEARNIARKPGVISVFADPVLQLYTTRSWDFLQYQSDLKTNLNSRLGSNSKSLSQGSDIIIGIIDTGIWPESESFNDNDMGPIPSRWKGVCSKGDDFIASNCNRKLIGARYYTDSTPRDDDGHGTHTASTAAGSSVPGAAYYGLAKGTAKGGSPESRIAIYKVCSSSGCYGSAILAGLDDAVGDGVDVVSLSIGSPFAINLETDPIAIGAFHAVERGITVICAGGNNGPDSETVRNVAPWILTVAATTIDRDFESDVVLGGNKVVKGEAINFSTLQKSPTYPLIYGESAKLKSSSANDARNCFPSSLNGAKIKGKIVLCYHSNDDIYTKIDKMEEVKQLGGVGLILIDDLERAVASKYIALPVTVVSQKEATGILSYIKSTRNPLATIRPTVTVIKYKPAPAVAYFSSRGPSFLTKNILKPDIAAPGVNILAAWIQTNNTSDEVPKGQKPSHFNVISGTSMACPHVSGIAATIKSKNPIWSPSAIKSAIMTTATQTNNENAPMTIDSGSKATPYDFGAGEIRPSQSLEPGLVYDTNTNDYLQFMCNYGFTLDTIKRIASVIPVGFDCPKNSSKDLISNLNYPSIAVSKFNGKESKKVIRTVTNVGDDKETTYVATIKSPPGLNVKVLPDKLQFTKNIEKLSYQMIFSSASSSSLTDDVFGSITWTNGKHKVQSPFVVSSGLL